MVCQIIKINPKEPEKNLIKKAAKIIKKGGLVAFPTETVYGLGANALNKKAVKKIFEAKNRPLDNPVIVHIADFLELFKLAKNIPKTAKILIRKFWPGPLTLVLFKKKIIPDEVTAGAETVAIRMPKNRIALELIKISGLPIAAPSANLAGRPSPTTAQDVFEDLGDKIDLILDGGKTKIGLESTVVDLTVEPPLILRPGGIGLEELKKVLKNLKPHPLLVGEKLKDKIVKSPGMKYRHYAPKALLILIEGDLKERLKKFKDLISFYQKEKKRVGIMISEETRKFLKNGDINLVVGSRKNLKEISSNLFKTLREFDKRGADVILAETFPEKGIGFAIMHRLKKAANKMK
jgi:L-threonylcarbamoyladenylate synthase